MAALTQTIADAIEDAYSEYAVGTLHMATDAAEAVVAVLRSAPPEQLAELLGMEQVGWFIDVWPLDETDEIVSDNDFLYSEGAEDATE